MKAKSNFSISFAPFPAISFSVVAWLPLIVYLIIVAIARVYAPFDNDEIEAVHTAWKMIHDGIIYRDFFQHHHPLYYYFLIPILKFFGESLTTLYVARIIPFMFFLSAGYAAYVTAEYFWNVDIALLTIYLLFPCPLFQKILEIRPDGAQTALCTFAILFLLYFLQSKHTVYLMLSAFSLAIAFLFLQKTIFLLFLIGCILLFYWWKKEISTTHVCTYAAITVAPFLLYLMTVMYSGSFDTYIKFNWLLNIMHPGRFLPVHTLPILFIESQLMVAGYLLGLLFFLNNSYQKIIAFISIGLLVAIIGIVKFSSPQYYAPALPLVAILAASALYELVNGRRIALAIFMLCSLAGPFIRISWFVAKHVIKKITNEQHKKLEYIWTQTTPNDFIYDGKTFFNLFRHDIHFFWFESRSRREESDLIPVYEKMMNDKYDIYAAIDILKPKIISNYYLDMKNPIIATQYIQTEYDDIWIRKST